MENLDIANYINQARESGMGDDRIREGMLQAGWSAADVEQGLKGSASSLPSQKPKWHPTRTQKLIAIIGTIAILGMVGAYAYVSYIAAKNFNEVSHQAKLAQEETQRLAEQRQNSPSTSSGQSLDFARDWQTYRNEEYGFEFKYPQDGGLEKDPQNKYDRIQNYISTDDFGGLKQGEYYIEIFYSEDANTCSTLGIENPVTKLIDSKEIISGSGPYGGDMGGDRRTICIDEYSGWTAVSITFESYSLNLADQILSTFRFIE